MKQQRAIFRVMHIHDFKKGEKGRLPCSTSICLGPPFIWIVTVHITNLSLKEPKVVSLSKLFYEITPSKYHRKSDIANR